MKKVGVSLLVTVLLILSLSIGVYSQTENPVETAIAQVQPLLIDIQQQVPVSVTVSALINDKQEMVTVPLLLDLNLQLSIADTVTATVETITPTRPALVTVSELMESGEALVDNAKIPYEMEPADGVEVIQLRSSENYSGDLQIVGELRNLHPERDLDSAQVVVTFYDEAGNLLDVTTGYTSLDTVEPGGTSPFRVIGTVPAEDVARYLIQVEARFER